MDGTTVRRLAEMVKAGDFAEVRAMLHARPELVNIDMAEDDEHRVVHYAVLTRSPEMVRLLMQRGADARKGIWPNRDATSALTIARERGYAEIVSIIEAEEARRTEPQPAAEARPSQSPEPHEPRQPRTGDAGGGHELTPRTAVIEGNAEWLRARHAEGTLENSIGADGGLVSLAVKYGRADILALLLDLGLDPDERVRLDHLEDVVFSAGGPLHQCARTRHLAMAEILLAHGANPNAEVYASGTALYRAYQENDRDLVTLLERYGGVLDAASAGYVRQTETATRRLRDQAEGRLPDGVVPAGRSVADTLLWSGAGGGDAEIVRLALERIDWERGDSRWHWPLWQALTCDGGVERGLACYRRMLDRADPNVATFGRTLLHDAIGSGTRVREADRAPFVNLLLDAGARTDLRDELLQATPLGWACRWGRLELVKLLLERGADPVEADAEDWATPIAMAEKMNHHAIAAVLRTHRARA